jgi:hypothetical protein
MRDVQHGVMRWVSIVAPHGYLLKELGFCDGILSPVSHIAYFRGPIPLIAPGLKIG